MTSESNKELVSRYFGEVINGKMLNLIEDIFSNAYISHRMDGKQVHSVQDGSLISFLTYFFSAFPDIHYEINNIIQEEDIVALNLTATGTHNGEFLGYAASQKKIQFKEMYFFRISNDRIVEGWGLPDVNGIREQISNQ